MLPIQRSCPEAVPTKLQDAPRGLPFWLELRLPLAYLLSSWNAILIPSMQDLMQAQCKDSMTWKKLFDLALQFLKSLAIR
jgi:hypothetical protein